MKMSNLLRLVFCSACCLFPISLSAQINNLSPTNKGDYYVYSAPSGSKSSLDTFLYINTPDGKPNRSISHTAVLGKAKLSCIDVGSSRKGQYFKCISAKYQTFFAQNAIAFVDMPLKRVFLVMGAGPNEPCKGNATFFAIGMSMDTGFISNQGGPKLVDPKYYKQVMQSDDSLQNLVREFRDVFGCSGPINYVVSYYPPNTKQYGADMLNADLAHESTRLPWDSMKSIK